MLAFLDRQGDGHLLISPKRPMIDAKTSTTRIRTNSVGSAASAMAAVDPVMPTATPQNKLQSPTVKPPQKRANPRVVLVNKIQSNIANDLPVK